MFYIWIDAKFIWDGRKVYFEFIWSRGRKLLSENRTLVEKMAEKPLFFEGFPINWRCYGKDINFKLLYNLEYTKLQLLSK